MFTLDEMYDYLADMYSEDYVQGGIAIGGYNKETLEFLLFNRTGYRTFEQYDIYNSLDNTEEEEE